MLQPLRLLSPTSAAEASGALAQYGDAARVYAGGAELVLLLRHGLVQAEYLVDVKHLAGAQDISWNGVARIGAAVSHRRLETDPTVQVRLPILAEAERHIGNIRIRCQGTLGGNLCFADPHADPPTALLVHDAMVGVHGPGGPRQMPLEEFLVGTFETALQSDELLTEIQVAPLPVGWGGSFQRIERFSRPTANAAAAVQLAGSRVAEARVAIGCIGPKAVRLHELEGALKGASIEDALKVIDESRVMLKRELDPVSDLLGSAAYKLHIGTVLLRRVFEEAVQRASVAGDTRP